MNIIRIQGEYERSQGIYYEYDRDGSLLGEGGMGRIYQGFRVSEHGRNSVAIKEIHENIARDPQLIERAMREASIQIDHENLLRMYGFVPNVEYDPVHNANITRYYMVMERLVGVNLDQIFNGVTYDRSGMVIPYAQELYTLYSSNQRTEAIVKIMKGVLSGIMALHDRGFIHRDIDPSNVMITIDNKIKLIDYGVCKQINTLSQEKHLTQAGSFIGKVSYAAPELALGDVAHQNRTTDIYALGVLIYYMAVGRLPFVGTNQDVLAAHVSQKMPVNDIPNKGLRRIVEKATQKRQERRYASAAEMIVDLEHINPSVSSSGGTTKGISMVQNPESTNTLLVWVLVALLGFILGVIVKIITL